jgi:hypothetical protein
MKKLFTLALIATGLMTLNAQAQHDGDKSKRKSPPAEVSQKLKNGATVKISYSQPSLNGRTIGKDVEPKTGQIWRTGANEATIFETDKDLTIMGEKVPAGKYSLFTIYKDRIATVILNRKSDLWGTDGYDKKDDAATFDTKVITASSPSEKLTFNITPEGTVSLLWGNTQMNFSIQQ